MPSATLYSDAFLNASNDSYTVTPSSDLWETWMRETDGWSRIFVKLTTPDGLSRIVSVGDPIFMDSELFQNCLFVPLWMLDSLACVGDGKSISYELLSPDSFPEATKIVVKPVDNHIHGVDVKQELEFAFTKLGVLQKNDTIVVSLHELGGIPTLIHIQDVEPAELVILEGDTIPIEFETSVYDSSSPPIQRPPTPIPLQPIRLPEVNEQQQGQQQQQQQQQSMIPTSMISTSSTTTPKTFVPFSGKGYSLK